MIEFEYFRPRADIRSLVGSYYYCTIENAFADVMRAEIANVRFMVSGALHSDMNGADETLAAGAAFLCGPTFKWSNVRFDSGTVVFGAAITPLGWARMFSDPADLLADRLVDLHPFVPPELKALCNAVTNAPDANSSVAAADHFFARLDRPERKINVNFLDQATRWITDPEPNELDDLLACADLSSRQINRLSKAYFGGSAKRLHRKFRALHSANRLTWQNLTDWRDVATTAYSDQPHFIREFKQFNGRTPSEFIRGPHRLVRLTLKERLTIVHDSPFSLVG